MRPEWPELSDLLLDTEPETRLLGPFTLVRPVVILAGAAWAAWTADTLGAALMSSAAGLVMANYERILTVGRPPWRGLEGDGATL